LALADTNEGDPSSTTQVPFIYVTVYDGDGLFGCLCDIGAIPIEAAGGFEATPGVVATGAQIRSGNTDS
jgi:hypothetical protein